MSIYQSMEINIPQSPVGKSGIVVYVGTLSEEQRDMTQQMIQRARKFLSVRDNQYFTALIERNQRLNE